MKKYKAMIAGVAMLAVPAICSAAPVTMVAGDGFGASSFNSAGQWDSVAAPTAGNDYFNAGNLLRTPADAGSYTFGGDSLTITGAGLAAAAGNDALMWKGSGTGAIITVDDLTIDGGQLRHGQGDADSWMLAGNLAIGANGANFATQGGMLVNSAISGSTTIRILDNGNGGAGRIITLGSGANTFTGDIELAGSDNAHARLALADNANLNFVIGASGVNNDVSGTGTMVYDGDFFFNLTGAGTTIGDSWDVAGVSAQSFGGTFTVAGFADQLDGTWYLDNGSAEYSFDTANGTLSVIPEPATMGLIVAMGGGMLFIRRRFMI